MTLNFKSECDSANPQKLQKSGQKREVSSKYAHQYPDDKEDSS